MKAHRWTWSQSGRHGMHLLCLLSLVYLSIRAPHVCQDADNHQKTIWTCMTTVTHCKRRPRRRTNSEVRKIVVGRYTIAACRANSHSSGAHRFGSGLGGGRNEGLR
eukprot:scaffold14000_cov44-Cyclotella_meneghiniana.AAC.2